MAVSRFTYCQTGGYCMVQLWPCLSRIVKQAITAWSSYGRVSDVLSNRPLPHGPVMAVSLTYCQTGHYHMVQFSRLLKTLVSLCCYNEARVCQGTSQSLVGFQVLEFRSCVKVEAAVLLTDRMVSVDVRQH